MDNYTNEQLYSDSDRVIPSNIYRTDFAIKYTYNELDIYLMYFKIKIIIPNCNIQVSLVELILSKYLSKMKWTRFSNIYLYFILISYVLRKKQLQRKM